MIKRCTISSVLVMLVFLLNVKMAYSQTCGSVTLGDITSMSATCPGNGTITAPTLASGTVYQLTGGNIAGTLSQSSPVFGSLAAGSYTVTILCSGVPAQSFNVAVANVHSALGMSLTGTMSCPGTGTINAAATGGFNMGGAGASYQYAMWPSADGGANRADGALTYGSASTFGAGAFAEGTYLVRAKDMCGNIFTQSIELESSRPTGKPFLESRVVACTGSALTLTFPDANLSRNPSGGVMPGGTYSAPFYQYRVEKVDPAGDCGSAAVISTITGNTNITSSSTLSSISISGVLVGERYRVVVISPCGNVETFACQTVEDLSKLEVKASRLCAPAAGANIRVSVNYFSMNGYSFKYPVSYTFTGGGGYTHTATAANVSELLQIQTNVAEAAFPITVTATDACGLTKTIVRNAPSSGSTPSTIYFDYNLSCVEENGTVTIYTYPEGNWFGLEYNSGSNTDKVKFELVNASTSAVASTVYGLNNQSNNQVIFRNIPAGASYFVRVTPPTSAGACAPQNSNTIAVPMSEALQFNVSPAVEKVCNNGLNNILYNVVTNSGSQLAYKLYAGSNATGTLVSDSSTPTNLAAGTYYYEISLVETCPSAAKRTGTITVNAWQVNPTISRSLSVNCQPLGSGPQTSGQALLQFAGHGPFTVERSIDGGTYSVVATAAVNSYSESSLTAGSTYNYRVTDQCGKSVSQQVMIKPLSPTLIENELEPCLGTSYTLSAIDFGDPLTTYTWEKVGVSGTLATTREYNFPSFSAANNGTYKLTVSLLSGCVVRETFVTLNSENCGEEFASGSIGDKVWFDNNSNGIQDATELGAANVPVSLQGYVGPSSPSAADLANNANWADIPGASTFTDSDGEYLFDGLDTGHYRVKFSTIPDYGFTTPNAGSDATVDSDAGVGGFSGAVFINALGTGIAKDNMTVDAGLVPAGSIGDYVWIDDNQNGQQDAGELPKSGVTVKLYVKNGSVWDLVDTKVTGIDGKYLFSGLPSGTYQVEFVLPTNHVFTHVDKSGVADDKDSDANQTTGKTGEITIDVSAGPTDILRNNMTIDAGLVEGGLPVKLSSFDVKKGENVSAILRWTTTEEVNSEKFEVQRSTDAKSWNAIGQVNAKVNSQGTVNYRFDDMQPNLGANYYRLKMIDLDGTFAYSIIRKLSGEVGAEVTIYPNPVSNELSVLSTTGQAIGKVELINQNGKILITKNGGSLASPINVKSLPAGIYLVKISFQNGSIENRKVVIVR